MPMVAQTNQTSRVATPRVRVAKSGRSRSPEKDASLSRSTLAVLVAGPADAVECRRLVSFVARSSTPASRMSSLSHVLRPLR